MRAVRQVAALVLLLAAASCSETGIEDKSAVNLCGSEAQVFDDTALASGGTPCLGDTLVLGLPPNKEVGAPAQAVEFPIDIPEAGRVRLCLDLDDHLHRLAIRDPHGLERDFSGQGCIETSVSAGRHVVRIANGSPAAADAAGYLLFVRPRNEVEGTAQGSNLLGGGDVILSTDCPGCDLRGVDWSGWYMACAGDIDVCGNEIPASEQACVTFRKLDANLYVNGSNFSNALFGGANFNAATFECVNFRGAQFYDSKYGSAKLQPGRNWEARTTPTTFTLVDFTGASFRSVDLRQANFTCYFDGQLEDFVYLPGTVLSGADLRGANLAGANFDPHTCIAYAGPLDRLDLTGVIIDATTNVSGTIFSGVDLSHTDMRQFHWTNANFKVVPATEHNAALPTLFHGAIFDGIDFTKAPYNTIFVNGANTNGILAGADLSSASFVSAILSNSVIEHTILRANFTKANLDGASFAQKDLRGTNFTFASLQKAQMANVFLGVSDEQYTQDPTLAANLSFAYMPGANLDHADLRHANFTSVHLYGTPATVSGALMGNANFGGAILSGLDFKAAQLQNVNFQGAQLVGCPLNNAIVTNANFASAHLEGADFTGANMASAILTNAALSRRGDFGTYTNQVLVYNGTQWTCQPTSTQKWCGKPTGTWSYTEQNGIPYTVLFNETVLTATATTTCPNATIGTCATVDQLTPVVPPFPPVPDCVPSATNWCSANPGTAS